LDTAAAKLKIACILGLCLKFRFFRAGTDQIKKAVENAKVFKPVISQVSFCACWACIEI